MSEIRLGIVYSEFNADITIMMLEVAKDHANFLGAKVQEVIKVPGAFDMPLAIRKLLQNENIDAVVTLGAVIKGDTKHDEVVASHAARKIMDLALEFGKPVSLGVSGPGQSHAQAKQRIEHYAKRSVEAAIKQVHALKK
ncbi:MAG: 6,7-dimethyl-8-ribityllumazine synthase [Promethearchaeota archaeon]